MKLSRIIFLIPLMMAACGSGFEIPDPIPGGKEFPCITRTIRAAVTMPLYADMALCGMDPIIPYHEMLYAIKKHRQISSHACLHDGDNVCPAAGRCADFLSGELMAGKLKYEA